MFGLMWTMVLVPRGTNGITLKSMFPYVATYADKKRLRQDDRSNLSVIVACGINLSHSFAGKFV